MLIFSPLIADVSVQLPLPRGLSKPVQEPNLVIRLAAEAKAYLHRWHWSPHVAVCFADPAPP